MQTLMVHNLDDLDTWTICL